MDGGSPVDAGFSLVPRVRREQLQQGRNKRTFSTMAASHRDETPDSSTGNAFRDPHYNNEHSSRRRRLSTNTPEPRLPRIRYAGDGLDYRRPVMSTAYSGRGDGAQVNGWSDGAGEGNVRTQGIVIDLTDDDITEESQTSDRLAPVPATTVTAASSRAQRLPRFGRNVIDVEGADDEAENTSTRNLPGANYLALPPRTATGPSIRPQFSGLRRPSRPPSPPSDMDDLDAVEFVGTRTRRSVHSRQPTPAAPRHGPRSVTPYPVGVPDEPVIDLTADDDDDVVLLNARPRQDTNNNQGGTNLAPPTQPANFVPPTGPARDYQNLGHIANMLREGGANVGGRLMQRLHGLMGFEAEVRAHDQARDHFNYNHRNGGHHHHHNHRANQHHHHHRHNEPARHRNEGGFGNLRPGGLPVLMDYDMTGFDLGLPGGNRPPTPKYSPPPEPEEGFTRGPGEDEVVVCPNCGDELAVGEGEVKQEIWVVKGCGHAYCGECAQVRGKSSTPKKVKGKGKATDFGITTAVPFKKCVVEGCGKPTVKSSMIRVYLGT